VLKNMAVESEDGGGRGAGHRRGAQGPVEQG
jgi:hypothetical protein